MVLVTTLIRTMTVMVLRTRRDAFPLIPEKRSTLIGWNLRNNTDDDDDGDGVAGWL